MKNILIVNAKKEFHHSKGKLNETLSNVAADFLRKNNCNVKVTTLENGYDIAEEVKNIVWADLIIYQFPAWWMSTPWTLKKYIDEVFTQGHGVLYASDGRTRSDPSKQYGSGGLLHGKKYMLSVTWNAPTSAFEDKNDFFAGAGVDGVHYHFHKANEFLGMSAIKTFMCNDVIKSPNVEHYIALYEQHLKENVLS
jgi:modulator of drug activity B